jgi:hypothetical protein
MFFCLVPCANVSSNFYCTSSMAFYTRQFATHMHAHHPHFMKTLCLSSAFVCQVLLKIDLYAPTLFSSIKTSYL